MSDLTIRNDILAELEFQPDIDAAGIGVSVSEGVVCLTGHVTTYAQKQRVERATKSIKGVRAVAQELTVRGPGDDETADDVIAARCSDLIHWCTAIAPENIRVKVQQGWVTLEGTVNAAYQRHAAQSAARKLTGVRGIDNLLKLAPKEPAQQDAKTQIEAAWARNAELDARHLRATVQGNTVVIEGRVHNWAEREVAERAAWSATGVSHVINDVLIA
jgi:osmotically-inducible protein OsmY